MKGWQRNVLAAVVAAIGLTLAVYGWRGSGSTPAMSGSSVAATIAQEMATAGTAPNADITCPPTVPLSAGHIYDCTQVITLDNEPIIRVTEDDAQGHFSWTVTAQQAPGANPPG